MAPYEFMSLNMMLKESIHTLRKLQQIQDTEQNLIRIFH